MIAAVLHEVGQALLLEERQGLTAGSGQVIVELKAAGLNRRDFWITQGMYPGIQCPVVLGSDGAGIVSKVGAGVDHSWLGRDVVVNPGLDWGPNQRVQDNAFQILGMPSDGTFAEQIVVPAAQLHAKPDHLSWEEAAALPLAGMTAYRALFTQGETASGQSVLITGIGGGVATYALTFAIACGAKVIVTSSSSAKIEMALGLGAVAGYNYREDGWSKRVKQEHGLMDVTIDGAGGEHFNQLIDLAAPGATIVSYGATAGPAKKLDMFKLFWKQLRLLGSTMGSPTDFISMVRFVNENAIKPVLDLPYPLMEVNDAIRRVGESKQFGNVILTMGPTVK